jgi:hypothetical protein
MVTAEDTKYKQIFLDALQPFMELLVAKQKQMTLGSWMDGVQQIQLRIIDSPEQYLGRELPTTHCIQKIVTEIFDDFITENVKEPADMLLTY